MVHHMNPTVYQGAGPVMNLYYRVSANRWVQRVCTVATVTPLFWVAVNKF